MLSLLFFPDDIGHMTSAPMAPPSAIRPDERLAIYGARQLVK